MASHRLAETREALLRRVDEANRLNRSSEAIEILRALSAVAPADPLVRGRLADALRRQGRSEEAAEETVALAQELRAREDDGEAARILRTALQADPTSALLQAALGQIERHVAEKGAGHEGSQKHLIQTVRRGVDSHPGPVGSQTRYDLGIAYKEMDLFDEAIAELTIAARDQRLAFDCLSLIAACCQGKGSEAEAITWLERALAIGDRTSEEYRVLRSELARLRRLGE